MLVQKKGVELIKNQSKLILDAKTWRSRIQHTYAVRNTSDYKNYQVDLVNLKKMHLLLFIVQEVIAQ